jgi:hypothetical protein
MDIHQFFRQIEGQLADGKRETLRLLVDKYIHLTRATVLLNKGDFDDIREMATKMYLDRKWPKKFKNSNRSIVPTEATNMCIIEATIAHLNNLECLKKTPKIDYED